MRAALLALVAALLALVAALAFAPATDAKNGFSVTPSVGGVHTKFVVTFAAPRTTRGDDFYDANYLGPPGCAEGFATPTKTVHKGDRVTLELSPAAITDINENDLHRHTWCPGVYTGYVEYCNCGGAARAASNTYVGQIVFTVRGRSGPQSSPNFTG